MIKFDNVVKGYQTRRGMRWILCGCSAELPRGRSVGILGRNGAGKSTMIRLLSGAERPDYGAILHDLRISWPIGFSGMIAGQMSGRDACMFVSRLYGEDPHRVIEFVRDFSELGNYFFERVGTYSSGMKAKLNFGLSMAIDFDCYLVDEVTAVGDARFQAKCLKAFQDRRSHADVIMVSHSLRTIRDYCDMGAVLHEGNLTLYDDMNDAVGVYQDLNRA